MQAILTNMTVRSQVYEPIDHLHLFGKDPLNDVQLGATYYIATGDSGQGTPVLLGSLETNLHRAS